MPLNILFCGGGTAGHVNPALAIAATLKEKHPDANIAFVASTQPSDKAAELVTREGYPLYRVDIQGAKRPLWSPSNVKTAVLMAVSRSQSKKIIKKFKPDVIVGTGGFACWPLLSVGADMKIPTLVHESNVSPGLAVSRLKNKLDMILVNFEETKERLGAKDADRRIAHVGNPHMPGFVADNSNDIRADARRELGLSDNDIYILSFGGSRGAAALSDAVVDMAGGLLSKHENAVLHHGTGKEDYERVAKKLKDSSAASCERIKLLDYIYDMPHRMAAADIVISRAGAMSVSELALTSRASVLVPSPNVADGHQYKNAKAIEDAGAGICIEEKDFSTGALERAVDTLIKSAAKRRTMGARMHEKFATQDANERIYEEISKLVKNKK